MENKYITQRDNKRQYDDEARIDISDRIMKKIGIYELYDVSDNGTRILITIENPDKRHSIKGFIDNSEIIEMIKNVLYDKDYTYFSIRNNE